MVAKDRKLIVRVTPAMHEHVMRVANGDDLGSAAYVRGLIREDLARRSPERCQYCSFQPTSGNDYCDDHRPERRRTKKAAS